MLFAADASTKGTTRLFAFKWCWSPGCRQRAADRARGVRGRPERTSTTWRARTLAGLSLVAWLPTTTLGHAMITQPWLWAICETLHFVGLALLIGTAGVFDLRLLGLLRRVSLSLVMDLRGWAALGLTID